MPVSGDTIRYSSASPLGLNFNERQRGASQSWDFSSLKSNGQDIYQYLSANKTPYLFYFFNQIGLKTADSIGASVFTFKNIYSFYTKSSTVFKAEGLGYSVSGIPLASNYSDEDEIYQFPLSFNDSDVSTFRFVFTIPGQTNFSFVQAGKRTNVVDAWGSIKTPYKTYNSVIRVKTIMDEVDTLVTQFGKIPVPRKQVIYKWLATSERIPVLEITGTVTGSTFTATQIRYRDSFNGIAPLLQPRARFDVSATSGYVNSDTFTFTDASRPFATSWKWNITPASDVVFVNGTTSTSRNPQVVFTQRGIFSATLTATNFTGSDDTTATDVITIGYGVNTIQPVKIEQVIFPNPASEEVFIRHNSVKTEVIIFDLAGKELKKGIPENERLYVGDLPQGIYILYANGVSNLFRIVR